MGEEYYKPLSVQDIKKFPYGPCFGIIKGYDPKRNYLIDTKQIYDPYGNPILTEEKRPLVVFRRKELVRIGKLVEFFINYALDTQIIAIDDLLE